MALVAARARSTRSKVSGTLAGLVVLSTDERVRRNAVALGFVVRP